MEAQRIKHGNCTSFNKENAPEQAWQNRIFIEHGNMQLSKHGKQYFIIHGNYIALYKTPTDLVLFLQIRL